MKNVKYKIFVLHGWAYSTEKWQPFLTLLKKQGIEPVMLQIPGLTAPLEEVWTLDNYVSWLKKSVEKEKGKVILLGHSNGGRIAISFAAKYPEKVAQLVLIDSAGLYHKELLLQIKRAVFQTIAKIGRKLHKSDHLRYLLYRFARENDYYRANPAVRKTMHNLIKVDLSPLLPQIVIPTLIIWGQDDKVTPVIDGERMQALLPNARLHIVNGAHHSPQFTHEKEVAAIITQDLEK
ncbi:MAG: alpha/beta hydrolase [Patescibacteria group bacterium]